MLRLKQVKNHNIGQEGEEKGEKRGAIQERGMSNVFSSKPHTVFHTVVT